MSLKRRKDRIAIVGLGKVGAAMGYLLKKAGYPITAVADASPEAIRHGHPFTGGHLFNHISDVAGEADAVFLAVPDDAIQGVCLQFVEANAVRPGQKFVHLSGAGALDLLAPVRKSGAFAASIHPIQSFADVQGAIDNIPGSTFGVTADEAILNWAVDIITDVKGVPFLVPDSDKPLYHAAACMASNYLTALLHIVEEIYQQLGLSREEAVRAFWPLVRGTLRNIETKGTVQALTGPIVRGDSGTVEKHVRAFQEKLPAYLPAYCLLGHITTDMARQRQSLSEEKAEAIHIILERSMP